MTDGPKVLFTCDRTQLGLYPDKEGKIKLTALQLHDGAVLLKDQILVISNVNGQVRAIIKSSPREVVDRLVEMFPPAGEAA